MKSVIVGTAGHIDHGKTALVKALTGIDADRLEEEKRRGITIDIGFAHLELPAPQGAADEAGTQVSAQQKDDANLGHHADGIRLGFVDVPGHERFVRNMLAGIGGIDLVLLVVAADESIKPQTREHFDICRLLGIRRGITVVTKSELVDSDTLSVVRLELEDFLRGSFLENAPIVAVSAHTGAGLDELRRVLAQVAAEVPAKDARAVFRLPMDRVFTMKGFGTVVTGTLLAGTVRKEDELEVFPGGRRVRVRGIQVHGAAAEQALAGQRTALNLAGASTEELARGMMLAPVGLFRSTRRIDVRLTTLPGSRPLRDRARAHFHCYTAETVAEVVLLRDAAPPWISNAQDRKGDSGAVRTPDTKKELRPGSTAWAQLRLAEPLLLLPGDRFILRQFSPVVTIGGGVVVDAVPAAPRQRKPALQEEQLKNLERLASGLVSDQFLTRVDRRKHEGLSIQDAIAETGWTRPQLDAAAKPHWLTPDNFQPQLKVLMQALAKVKNDGTRATGVAEQHVFRFNDRFVSLRAIATAALAMTDVVRAFHEANSLVAGISKEELREKLDLGPEVFNGVLDALVRDKKLEVAGEQVRLAGRGVVMKDEEAESKRQIEQAFATAGLKVPALKDVLAGLKVDRARAQKIVTLLLRDRVLVKVADDLVFHRDALEALRKLLASYKTKSTSIDVAGFKDLAGISRKYAIPLLEYLDRERVTRRVGDQRVIL